MDTRAHPIYLISLWSLEPPVLTPVTPAVRHSQAPAKLPWARVPSWGQPKVRGGRHTERTLAEACLPQGQRTWKAAEVRLERKSIWGTCVDGGRAKVVPGGTLGWSLTEGKAKGSCGD